MRIAPFDRDRNRSGSAGTVLLWLLVLASPLWLGTGCRTTRDNQFDVLESELRAQEDYIYELEDYLVDYSEKLRQCRCTQCYAADSSDSRDPTPADKPSGKKARKIDTFDDDDESLLEPDLPESEIETEPDLPDDVPPLDLDVPELDIEPLGSNGRRSTVQTASASRATKRNRSRTRGRKRRLELPDPVDYLEQDQPVAKRPKRATVSQTRPRTKPDLTPQRAELIDVFRSAAEDDGPDSLLTVIELLNADDEPVDAEGHVSVMVVANVDGKQQHLQRWDFTDEETESAWQTSHLGDGLHLELPLTRELPADKQLEIWARFMPKDGQKLLTKQQIDAAGMLVMEAETGAKELRSETALAEQTTRSTGAIGTGSRNSSASSEMTIVHNSSAGDEPNGDGWRRSMERTDATARGYASTSAGRTPRWRSQSPGTHYAQPETRQASFDRTADRQPTSKPSWTAARASNPIRDGATSASEGPADWLPYR